FARLLPVELRTQMEGRGLCAVCSLNMTELRADEKAGNTDIADVDCKVVPVSSVDVYRAVADVAVPIRRPLVPVGCHPDEGISAGSATPQGVACGRILSVAGGEAKAGAGMPGVKIERDRAGDDPAVINAIAGETFNPAKAGGPFD